MLINFSKWTNFSPFCLLNTESAAGQQIRRIHQLKVKGDKRQFYKSKFLSTKNSRYISGSFVLYPIFPPNCCGPAARLPARLNFYFCRGKIAIFRFSLWLSSLAWRAMLQWRDLGLDIDLSSRASPAPPANSRRACRRAGTRQLPWRCAWVWGRPPTASDGRRCDLCWRQCAPSVTSFLQPQHGPLQSANICCLCRLVAAAASSAITTHK